MSKYLHSNSTKTFVIEHNLTAWTYNVKLGVEYDGQYYINDKKYSHTSSNHKSQLKKFLSAKNIDYILVPSLREEDILKYHERLLHVKERALQKLIDQT